MGKRREARELALQALYQADMSGGGDGLFWTHFAAPEGVEAFARELVDGVRGAQEQIDALIAATSEHWRLPRLGRVDLGVLRLGTFELLARPEIPASVTINEAIEIARRFGGEDSAAFVNGVLDAIAGALGTRDKADSAT